MGGGIRKHLEVSVDDGNWLRWRQEQNWPLLPAVSYCHHFYVAPIEMFLEAGLCLVLACVLRCLRLVLVASWLQSRVENDWLAPVSKPWPEWVTHSGLQGTDVVTWYFSLHISSGYSLASYTLSQEPAPYPSENSDSLPAFQSGPYPVCALRPSLFAHFCQPLPEAFPPQLSWSLALPVQDLRPTCYTPHFQLDPWCVFPIQSITSNLRLQGNEKLLLSSKQLL